MKFARIGASAALAVILAQAQIARSTPPPFEVAYRAWEVATGLARDNRDPKISGECGKTFRPFVIAGLRMQTKQEQDIAAATCVEVARSACANAMLRKSAETIRKCEEFR